MRWLLVFFADRDLIHNTRKSGGTIYSLELENMMTCRQRYGVFMDLLQDVMGSAQKP